MIGQKGKHTIYDIYINLFEYTREHKSAEMSGPQTP